MRNKVMARMPTDPIPMAIQSETWVPYLEMGKMENLRKKKNNNLRLQENSKYLVMSA